MNHVAVPRFRALTWRVVAVAFWALSSVLSHAQPSASAPIKLVVPFTPGTGIDLVARQIGPHLARRLGRAVVVENKAGASGNIGTESVIRAPADGSTLLVTVSTVVMNPALYPKLSFDPLRDLEPVTLTSWGQLVQVSSLQSGINTAQAMIARYATQERRQELLTALEK